MKYTILLICYLTSSSLLANSLWPVVIESSNLYKISRPEKAAVKQWIYSKNGKHLYSLICRTGNYEKTEPFNFSGFLHCGLFTPENYSNTLFKEHKDAVEWENRGRFLLNHLRKGCAEYKNWGQERHFLVRGLDITLAIKNIAYDTENRISGYQLVIEIDNYSEAKKGITEVPEEKEPEWFYKKNDVCLE